tara:strand:+ start:1533 stop:2606 length:1074 start_codon:yes stop_codon:yes gene_type:complete
MKQLQTEIGLLLKGKSSFSPNITRELGDLVDKYPYAPIFHFLYLRSLQEEDSYKFPSQLNRSSVSTMNRSALLDWAETPLIPIEIQVAALEENNQKKQPEDLQTKTSKNWNKRKEEIEKPEDFRNIINTGQAKPLLNKSSYKTLDLSSLPEKVRDQVIRSRAIKAKYGSVKNDDSLPSKIRGPELSKISNQLNHEKEINLRSNDINDQNPVEKKKTKSGKGSKTLKPVIKKDSAKYRNELSPFAQFLNGLKPEVNKNNSSRKKDRDIVEERTILEQFIELNPKISARRDFEKLEDLTLKTPNVSGLVTETLANHYFDQGAFSKAIQAYEIMKLKVPQKSGIFAARIAEMRNLQSEKK